MSSDMPERSDEALYGVPFARRCETAKNMQRTFLHLRAGITANMMYICVDCDCGACERPPGLRCMHNRVGLGNWGESPHSEKKLSLLQDHLPHRAGLMVTLIRVTRP